jgi:hypothetical protein
VHGQLAQLVALAAHGTAFLRGASAAAELYPGHTTFRFVGAIEFVRPARAFGLLGSERAISSGTAEWLRDLRDRGTTALPLLRSARVPRHSELAPHLEAGFANGLDVGLYARESTTTHLWGGTWQVTAPKDREQRIWSVRYRAFSAGSLVPNTMTLDEAAARLERALEGTRACALENGWERWAAVFAGAMRQLVSDAPTQRYHVDLLPTVGYGLRARQVLAAVTDGWVLGGMGSWNDMLAKDQARYTRVTVELYEALIDGAVAGANSFEDPPAAKRA